MHKSRRRRPCWRRRRRKHLVTKILSSPAAMREDFSQLASSESTHRARERARALVIAHGSLWWDLIGPAQPLTYKMESKNGLLSPPTQYKANCILIFSPSLIFSNERRALHFLIKNYEMKIKCFLRARVFFSYFAFSAQRSKNVPFPTSVKALTWKRSSGEGGRSRPGLYEMQLNVLRQKIMKNN